MPILLNIHEKWMSYATPLKSSLTSWNPCLVSPETTCSCSTDKHQTKSMSKTKGQLQQKTLQTPFLAFLCLSFDRITDSVTEATKGLTKTSDSSKFWDSQLPQILPRYCPVVGVWARPWAHLWPSPFEWLMDGCGGCGAPTQCLRTNGPLFFGGKAFGQTGGSYLITVDLKIYQG